MSMLRCLAVDDEPLALDLLEDNIRQVSFLTLVGRCKNAIEAIEVLQKEQVDLLFLDVQMPGLTGIQLLKNLKTKPMVIFITAYKNYAVESFELDVLDYLVKPVPFERFLKSVTKALEFHNLNQKGQKNKEYLFVNADYTLLKVTIKNIVYIEGLKDYIKIFLTTSTKPVITRLSMKAMEESLPSDQFIRTHKSFIIAVEHIISIRKNRIKLKDKDIPLSDHYKESLMNLIQKENF
ncbi:MAG: response regulator transcription factor [Cyclobacteriaceae bacterium]|nr:response regulator transcription factor [Cyclobacteriaceae bacterium SS2]